MSQSARKVVDTSHWSIQCPQARSRRVTDAQLGPMLCLETVFHNLWHTRRTLVSLEHWYTTCIFASFDLFIKLKVYLFFVLSDVNPQPNALLPPSIHHWKIIGQCSDVQRGGGDASSTHGKGGRKILKNMDTNIIINIFIINHHGSTLHTVSVYALYCRVCTPAQNGREQNTQN